MIYFWGTSTISETEALALEERGEAHVNYGSSEGFIILVPGAHRDWRPRPTQKEPGQ